MDSSKVRPSGRCKRSCCGRITLVNSRSCSHLNARKSAVSGRQRPCRRLLQDVLEGRLSGKPIFGEAPHRGERRVEEDKLLDGAIDREGGADGLQYLGIGVDMPPQLCCCGFAVGAIHGESDYSSRRAWHFADL